MSEVDKFLESALTSVQNNRYDLAQQHIAHARACESADDYKIGMIEDAIHRRYLDDFLQITDQCRDEFLARKRNSPIPNEIGELWNVGLAVCASKSIDDVHKDELVAGMKEKRAALKDALEYPKKFQQITGAVLDSRTALNNIHQSIAGLVDYIRSHLKSQQD